MAESTNPTANRYKYTGKELLTDHGVNILDYGPRPYDPTTGTWWSVDEHSADYALTSHYSMCGADPINHIDPDGKDWIYHDEFGYKWDKDVTKDSELEEGWQYVGKENNSILNHLGLSSDSYRVEKEVMGAGGGNNDNGTITYNNLLISLHLNIKFTPLVYMNNNQRQFQGVEMNFMENQIAVTNSDITINPATEIKFEFNKTRFLYPQPYRESVVYTKGSTPRIGRFVFEAQSLKYSSLPDEIIYTTGWNYSTPDGHGAIGLIGAFNAISFRRTIKIRLK